MAAIYGAILALLRHPIVCGCHIYIRLYQIHMVNKSLNN